MNPFDNSEPGRGRRRDARTLAAVPITLIVMVGGGQASAEPGDLDAGFGGAGHGRVAFNLGGPVDLRASAVQPGGGTIIVGEGSGSDGLVYRLKPDGRLDHRLGTVQLPSPLGASEGPTSAVAQPDGKVVIVGSTGAGAARDFAVWRVKATGALDKRFGDNGVAVLGVGAATNEAGFDVDVDSEGRIVIAGFSIAGGEMDLAVARLTADGVPDTGFNDGEAVFVHSHAGNDLARRVTVASDGKVVVAATYSGTPSVAVVRITPGSAGSPGAALDPTFGGGAFPADSGIATVPDTTFTGDTDIAMSSAGRILLLTAVTPVGGQIDGTVVRLLGTGAVDPSYAGGSPIGRRIDLGEVDRPHKLVVLPRGGVAVLGSTVGGSSYVAKLGVNGALDTDMGPRGARRLADLTPRMGAGEQPDIAAMPDGRIVAVGDLTGVDDRGVAYRLRGDFQPPGCAGVKATITGTKSADRLVGTRRADVIAALGGADTVTGLGRGDIVCAGAGNDRVVGGPGADRLLGQGGRDVLRGGGGSDALFGGPGRDRLLGGAGKDTQRQ